MKHYYLSILFTALMSLVDIMASAHDIELQNSDGKTIYYNYNSDGRSVSVTYKGTSYSIYSNEYSGELVIPKTITYVGKTYSVTNIGISAFYNCSGLKLVIIPNSVTSIGNNAFFLCSGLTTVTIPGSVTSIGNDVFCSCSGLTSINVSIDNKVYDSRNNCNAIIETSSNSIITGCKNTIIPNSITQIGEKAFYGCSGLTSVTIPNSVTSIEQYAFSGCSGLTSVNIGNSVTSIGDYAFNECKSITKFKSMAVMPPLCGENVFYNINMVLCVLYVPNEENSIYRYQAYTPWTNFNHIEELSAQGDCNGDSEVTMADANAVVNYFLAKGTSQFIDDNFDEDAADVNNDGQVTMADANQIVNMFLGSAH